MAAKKKEVSQIQKDINKLLVDTEKSIEKYASDTLKRIRKSIQALAKQTEQLERKIEGKKKAGCQKARREKSGC
jgi:hypothetical protein